VSKQSYSLRCQDLHTAVNTNVDPTSGYLSDYKNTRIIGMAGQVISTIHGMDVVDYERFEPIVAHQYGIDSMWLEKVFEVLQECDLVSLKGKKNSPEKIHVKTSFLKNNYETLSTYLNNDMNPRLIEITTIDILQNLAVSPLTNEEIKSNYNITQGELEKLKVFGRETQLLQFTDVEEGRSIISTPMYWDENANVAYELMKSHSPEKFKEVMQKVKNYQGFPVDNFSNSIMTALLSKGILPTPTVRMNGKDYPFVFTPYNTVPEEKVILEKARDILACVRCGQHFAEYPISNPYYILNALLDATRGYRLRATTVAKEQYFLLASKGIGILDNTGGNWYSFRLIDTPENIMAVKLAIDLLEHGEKVAGGNERDEEIKSFLGTRGVSISAFKSIKEANKKKDVSPEMAKELLNFVHGAYTYKGGKQSVL
jgi:hypothetical protein